MIYMGQTDRYMGEMCWSWSGYDGCSIPYTFSSNRVVSVLASNRAVHVCYSDRVIDVQSINRISIVL